MKTKEEIVKNWLPRYTGQSLEKFGKYILLTNFSNYVNLFSQWHSVDIVGSDKPMQCATADGISIINFGMGSPTAATVMDLLTAIEPEAVLFLGKCGGLKRRNKLGDLILPIAAIRGEGTSNDYFPPEVPALPAFALQKAISTTIRDYAVDYWTELFIQQTVVYGNTMKSLKTICRKYEPMQSIWKPQAFLLLVFIIKFQPVHCYW